MDRRVYDNYVMQIAEHGSLTKAAAALGISQPALSSGLTALEKEVGFTIFNRRRSPVTFTPEGEIYYSFVQRTRVLAEDMQKRVDAMQTDLEKRLVVGAPVAYTDSMVSDAVVRLLEKHPDYKVSLKSGPLAELIELAGRGEINCFVSTSAELPANLEVKLIKNEKLYLCIPKECDNSSDEAGVRGAAQGENGPAGVRGAAQGENGPADVRGAAQDENSSVDVRSAAQDENGPVGVRGTERVNGQENACGAGTDIIQEKIKTLGEMRMILLEEGQPLQKEIENFLRRYYIEPESTITVNQVSTAVNLALRGVGACIASEDALSNVSKSERCEKLSIYRLNGTNIEAHEEAYDGRRIYIAYDKELKMPNAGAEFIRLITESA